MRKTLLPSIACAASFAAATFLGCSGDSTPPESPDSGDDAPLDAKHERAIDADDAAGDETDIDAGCPSPEDESAYQPPAHHEPSAPTSACTDTQIQDFVTACLVSTATQATCDAFNQKASSDAALKACAKCMLTQETAQTYGPIIVRAGGVLSINLPGCVEMEDPSGGKSCALAMEASDGCDLAACGWCAKASDQLFQQCLTSASQGTCSKWTGPAQQCENAELDAGASACFSWASNQNAQFSDIAEAVLPIFCAASASDAGGGG